MILSALQRQPMEVLRRMQILDAGAHVLVAADFAEAVKMAHGVERPAAKRSWYPGAH